MRRTGASGHLGDGDARESVAAAVGLGPGGRGRSLRRIGQFDVLVAAVVGVVDATAAALALIAALRAREGGAARRALLSVFDVILIPALRDTLQSFGIDPAARHLAVADAQRFRFSGFAAAAVESGKGARSGAQSTAAGIGRRQR